MVVYNAEYILGNELFTVIDSEKVKVVVFITLNSVNYYYVGRVNKAIPVTGCGGL
jgi:hypothetical protein